jgi:hypothetical protein
MTRNEYGIDIVERLDYLLKDIIDKYDIIAPIARKGIRVLELSSHADSLFDNEKVLYYSSIRFHVKELRNKKIVLFDESVRTGGSLTERKDDLMLFSMKKKLGLKIETAALLVHNHVKELPRYYLNDLVCDNNLYDILSDELSYKILSTGRPLDVDHPIISIKLPQEVIPDLLQHLNKIAHTEELGHSGYFEDVRMFTVEFQDIFKIPEIDEYPHLFDEGPKKIRLFLKADILHCVPVIYPCLDISKTPFSNRKSCALLKMNGSDALCNIINLDNTLDKGNSEFQTHLCYMCVVHELNCRLMGGFLNQLKDVIQFEFTGIEKRNLHAIYHKEGKELGVITEKKIKSIMEKYSIPQIGQNEAERCYLNKINPVKRNYLLSSIRPEIEVAMAISKHAEVNQRLFKYGNYSTTKRPQVGLSYYQISDMMKELDEHAFSEGMDVALDLGLLKPSNPSEGIEVTCGEGSFRAIVRLYCMASEDVDKSLKFFANLVTAEETIEGAMGDGHL